MQNGLNFVPEKSIRGSTELRTVLYLGLLSQIFCPFYRRVHSLHGEESGQISGVGRDHDQSEEPPDTGHDTCGHGPIQTHG